jgi:hypothetical protein
MSNRKRKKPTLGELMSRDDQDQLIEEKAEEILSAANEILDGHPSRWSRAVELMKANLDDLDALVNPERMTKYKWMLLEDMATQLWWGQEFKTTESAEENGRTKPTL